MNRDGLNEASEDSFPASDPPSLTSPAPAEREGRPDAQRSSERPNQLGDDGETGEPGAEPE
jgi:hypothetical protein